VAYDLVQGAGGAVGKGFQWAFIHAL
jgi:hypothetical protein